MATREEIQFDLIEIVANNLNVAKEAIDDETTLEALGADSLDKVELIMSIEEHFGIDIKDQDVEKCKTFDDIVNVIIDTIGNREIVK